VLSRLSPVDLERRNLDGNRIMEDDLQTRADERLSETLETTGAPDPRAHCRALLKHLRSRNESAYAEAVAHYRTRVLPAVAGPDQDPLTEWIAYGVRIAELGYSGRTVIVDGSGRSRPYAASRAAGEIVLHLPEDQRARALVVSLPSSPTPAQRAALDLLVEGKQQLDEHES